MGGNLQNINIDKWLVSIICKEYLQNNGKQKQIHYRITVFYQLQRDKESGKMFALVDQENTNLDNNEQTFLTPSVHLNKRHIMQPILSRRQFYKKTKMCVFYNLAFSSVFSLERHPHIGTSNAAEVVLWAPHLLSLPPFVTGSEPVGVPFLQASLAARSLRTDGPIQTQKQGWSQAGSPTQQ